MSVTPTQTDPKAAHRARYPDLYRDLNARVADFRQWAAIADQDAYDINLLRVFCDTRNAIDPLYRFECRETDGVLQIRYERQADAAIAEGPGRPRKPSSTIGRLRALVAAPGTTDRFIDPSSDTLIQTMYRVQRENPKARLGVFERSPPGESPAWIEIRHYAAGEEPRKGRIGRPPGALANRYPFDSMTPGDKFVVTGLTPSKIAGLRVRAAQAKLKPQNAGHHFSVMTEGTTATVTCIEHNAATDGEADAEGVKVSFIPKAS